MLHLIISISDYLLVFFRRLAVRRSFIVSKIHFGTIEKGLVYFSTHMSVVTRIYNVNDEIWRAYFYTVSVGGGRRISEWLFIPLMFCVN